MILLASERRFVMAEKTKLKVVKNYVVLDLETTGFKPSKDGRRHFFRNCVTKPQVNA